MLAQLVTKSDLRPLPCYTRRYNCVAMRDPGRDTARGECQPAPPRENPILPPAVGTTEAGDSSLCAPLVLSIATATGYINS